MNTELSDKKRLGNWLKIAFVSAIVVMALATMVYVLRGSKVQSNYQFCYEECVKMGVSPKDGKCENSTYLGERKTDKGTYKKGDPWCYNNNGVCLNACKDL